MTKREPLTAKLRVNFTPTEAQRITEHANSDSRSVASVIRIATLNYLKERGIS